MKYQQRTFTLPVSSNKVTQEEWDKIFNPPVPCPVCGSNSNVHDGNAHRLGTDAVIVND